MIYAVFVSLLLLIGIGVAYGASQQPASRHSLGTTTLRAGLVIASARLAILWTSAGFMAHADWRQVAGYMLLMLNCLPEMGVVRSWRNDRLWLGLVSVLVTGTSFGLGYAWARIQQSSRSADS